MEAFVDVSDVAEWDGILKTIVGFILFLVTLQMLKALRHRPPFSVFTKVYHRAAMDLVVFGVSGLVPGVDFHSSKDHYSKLINPH